MDELAVSNKKIEDALKKFPVSVFDFERAENINMNACSFAIIGSSKSGKTTVLKYILKKFFSEDLKVFMTQSPQNDIYDSIKKETVYCPAYIPDIIKTCYDINKHTKNHYPFCIVCDDVVGAKNDKQMTKLLCLYRNSRLSALIVGQDCKMLNPTGRANVNNVLLFWQNTDTRCEENIKDFLRTYLPRNLTVDEKIELYKKLTADHCFIWIDQLNNTVKRCRLNASQIVS